MFLVVKGIYQTQRLQTHSLNNLYLNPTDNVIFL